MPKPETKPEMTIEMSPEPPDNRCTYKVFFRRDINSEHYDPLEIVAWKIWLGGWREVKTWPWNHRGCADAGKWAVQHHAVDRDGHRIRNRDDFMGRADAAEREERFRRVHASLTKKQQAVMSKVLEWGVTKQRQSRADSLAAAVRAERATADDKAAVLAALDAIGGDPKPARR